MLYFSDRPPKYNIFKRIIKYGFFNILLTISPILINIFISFTNQIPYKTGISYCPDICFMTIVTASSFFKDSFMSKTIKKNNFILGGITVFNIIFIVCSMLIYGNITKDVMTPNIESNITMQQYIVSLVCYILSVIFGFGIQIGGGIDE